MRMDGLDFIHTLFKVDARPLFYIASSIIDMAFPAIVLITAFFILFNTGLALITFHAVLINGIALEPIVNNRLMCLLYFDWENSKYVNYYKFFGSQQILDSIL